MKVNFNKSQKFTVLALIVMGLFNPMSVEVLDQYFKLVYTGLFLAGSLWVVFYLLKTVLTPQKLNIPAKTKKTAKQAYIAT